MLLLDPNSYEWLLLYITFFRSGIAPNMMLAKVSSDMNKPDGQHEVAANRQAILDFIQELPIRKV